MDGQFELSWVTEPLAAALAIQQLHGDRGPAWIVVRIGEAALAGDKASIDVLKRIAFEYDKLLAGSTH